jgi:protease-4
MAGGKGKWVFIILAIVLVSSLWIGAIVFFFTRASGGGEFAGEFQERLVEEGNEKKVAMIDLSGLITSEATGPVGAVINDEETGKQLEQAIEDDNVVAVILNLDTPGGEVVASDNIHREVEKVRKAKKPVVALMNATAASGGYYIAAGANEIVANSETLTGSIGVILTVFNVEGAAAKLGIEEIVIKSGPHKDIASPFRPIPPDEQKILQDLIDESFDKFVGIVSRGRNMPRDKVLQIADGRVYSGKQAMDLGLIDRLGGRDTAFARAKALAKSPGAKLVRYQRNVGLGDLLNPLSSAVQKGSLEQQTGIHLRPALKYLWLPTG